MILFGLGFWIIGGLIPPPSPDASAETIRAFYDDHPDRIRFGLFLSTIAAALTAPWVAVISSQMKRVEGTHTPLANTQLGTGMLAVLLFVIPVFMMQAAAFRTDRDADIIMAINDMAWLPFIGAWPVVFVQLFALGCCVFRDEDEVVFPRWLGYFNFWCASLLAGASLIYFFKTGPFAWNGLFALYLALVVFAIWFTAMFLVLRKAIQHQHDLAA